MKDNSFEHDPGCLCMTLTPDHQLVRLRIEDTNSFYTYVDEDKYACLHMPTVPDYWEIGYRFEDRSQIPHINDLNNTQYLAKLLDITELLGMWPTHVVRLRDAVFCEQHEIDIHSPQASHDHLLEHRFFHVSNNCANDKLV